MKETKLMGKKQFRWIILIGAILMLSMILNLNTVRAVQAKNPDALVLAKISEPSTFEPTWAWDTLSIELIVNCYERLIAYDRENVDVFLPSLASEVPTVENGGISPDGLTYRFHIRGGVTFVNGLPLTPEDVEYTFKRSMVRDSVGSPTWWLVKALLGVDSTRDGNGEFTVSFEDIDNAVVVEGNDVVFHLARPFAPFMQLIVSWHSSIVSKQWCIAHGDWPGTEETWEEYNNSPDSPLDAMTMGTGPYTLVSWTLEEVVLTRNDLYWRGPAKLKEVVHKINSDPAARVQMLIDGDVDSCRVPTNLYSELEGVEGIRLYEGLLSPIVYYYIFNYAIPDSSPYIGSGLLDGNGITPDFFNDLDVRKAFAYAFDYDGVINDLWLGEAVQPASLIVKGLPFYNPDQAKYTFDLATAKDYFQQAMGGQVWESGFSFSLPYWTLRGYALAEMIKINVESINSKFHMDLVEVPYGEMFSGQLPMYLMGWGADFPDPDNFFLVLLHSAYQYYNGYNNPLVDALIEQGESTLIPEERQAIYYELQSIYHDEVIGIPFLQPIERHYERDWLQGWYYNPFTIMDYYSIWKGVDNLVYVLITHVEDLVDIGVLKPGAGNSLISKLESVIHLIDYGNIHGASQKLMDFINQVQALIESGRLPMDEGQELINLAQEIIELLGGT